MFVQADSDESIGSFENKMKVSLKIVWVFEWVAILFRDFRMYS